MTGEIAGLIKRLALDAVEAGKPADILFGRVIAAAPLRIMTDQKIILEEDCLILCGSVKDRCADISFAELTDEAAGYDLTHSHGYSGETALSNHVNVEPHSHSYSGRTESWGLVVPPHSHRIRGKKKAVLHLGLKAGENVVLLRFGGGQRFLVLDRTDAPFTEGEWAE